MKLETKLSDKDIRSALKDKLSHHHNDPDTAIIEELGLKRGEVRVDVAVVNGTVHGYEIKSDRDSLRRLTKQVDIYSKVLDYATLVVGCRHLEDAIKIIPKWWGLIRVKKGSNRWPSFKTIRHSGKNPSRDARVLVELLWLDDALSLLEQYKLVRGIRGKPRRIVWDRICDHLDINVISTAVCEQLKARTIHLTDQ